MADSVLGPQAMRQLHGLFRDTAKLKRRRRDRMAPRRAGGAEALDGYILATEASDTVTKWPAWTLAKTTQPSIQVVFTGTVSAADVWAVTLGGQTTPHLTANISGPDLLAAIESLPSVTPGQIRVTAFPGRYFIHYASSVPSAASGEFSLYTQPIDYALAGATQVQILHLEQDQTVSAGSFAWGGTSMGELRVLCECRDFRMTGGSGPGAI